AANRGLLPLGREYLQRALTLAPESDQVRLAEELGDGYWLAGAYGAYGVALRRWRQQEVQDPLLGARLLRKMLYVWLRTDVVPAPDRAELTAMAAEAQMLVERAGDENEFRRVRVASLCLAWRQKIEHQGAAIGDEVRSGREQVLAAVAQLATAAD